MIPKNSAPAWAASTRPTTKRPRSGWTKTTGSVAPLSAGIALGALFAALPYPSFAQESGTYEQSTHQVHALHTSPVAPDAPLPPFDITAAQETGAPGQTAFSASGNVHVVGGRELDLRADSVSVNQATGKASAIGNVRVHEIDTTFLGSSLAFDLNAKQGRLLDALFEYPPFYVSSASVLLSPTRVAATNATVSTCPPDKRREFHILASEAVFDAAKQRVYLHNAKFYVYGTRVFTLRRYLLRTSPNPNQNAINQTIRPSFGYDNQRGPYLVIGRNFGSESIPLSASILVPTRRDPSASITTSTTIALNTGAKREASALQTQTTPGDPVAQIRNFASFPGRPLPDGDPLLFHDFLGGNPLESVLNAPVVPALEPSAALAYREPLYGRRIGNLNLSRLPAAALRLDIPLFGRGPLPSDRDPLAVRRALRSLYVFATANASTGYYEEQPTDVKSDRTAASVTLDTRPLLVGNNLLFRPNIRFYEAAYVTSHTRYGYQQINVSLQRSYNEYSAIGLQYIYTAQHGSDPFLFDSVDTTQELDLRGQTTLGHDIVGVRFKYDLRGERLYDYQIDYSFPQNCFIPTLLYDNVSHVIGFGFNIPGVTF